MRRVVATVVLLIAWPGTATASTECSPGPSGPPRDILTGQGVLENITTDHDGRLYLSDMGGGRVLRVDRPGAEPRVLASFQGPGGLTWDADGTLIAGYGNSLAQAFADAGTAGLNRVDPDTGATSTIVSGLGLSNGVVRARDGWIYVTNTFGREGGRIDRARDGRVELAWSPIDGANGLVLDLAGETLYAADSNAPRVMRIPIARPTEFATHMAAYHFADDGIDGLDGMTRDDADRLFVANQTAGEVWRVDGRDQVCVLARGMPSAAAVGFGGGGGGFPAENLYVVTFTGRVVEIPGASDVPPSPGPPLRLRLSVAPRSAPAGRATRFRFRVTALDRGRAEPLAGATVRFAGRRVRTNADGRATLVRRIARGRVLPANTSRGAYEPARTSVRIYP